jgi:hypothetical protein
VRKRRVAELLAACKLVREEAAHVVAHGECEGRGIRLERLDDHLAGRIAPASAGQLCDELERALLRSEVREREACIRVHDRRDLDSREVVPLRDHLRADERRGASAREALQRVAQRAGLRGNVGIESDSLEPRHPARELGVQTLRPRPDPGELDRATHRAFGRKLDRETAVVAMEPRVRMERQRDVAAPAPLRRSARPAVDRARDAAPVEEQDRPPAPLRDAGQLGEERGRQRVARLPAQIDELDRRQRGADARRQLESLQPFPALGARCRAPVDGDRALERSALRGDRARVIAWIRLLFERRVVLLVHDDEPQPLDGSEDRGPGTNDHSCRPRGDALALVAPLGAAEPRVEDGYAVTEALAKAPDGLRREGDLGNEHDDAATARERCGARLKVHLRLAAPRRPVQQDVPTPRIQRRDDVRNSVLLGRRQLLRLGLTSQRFANRRRTNIAAAPACVWRDERESSSRSRAVVVGEPQRELDERRGNPVHDAPRIGDVDTGRGSDARLDDDSAHGAGAQPNRQDVALGGVGGDAVRERARKRARRHERVDLRKSHGERA